MDQEKIGNFIKNLRKTNNLTQAELANKLGVTYQAVSKWENGKNIPDIAILNQISKEFNVDISDLLGINKVIETKKHNNKIINYIFIFLVIILSIIVIFLLCHKETFEFKTLSTTCKQFNITGSAAYTKDKSSIYISNINYCGGDDNKEYKKIECSLYENDNNTEFLIDKKVIEDSETLEEYLKDISFTIEKYDTLCKDFLYAKLYLKIDLTDEDGIITSYKVPLEFNSDC